MASRVEKYYSEQDSATNRSQKNKDLYDAIDELDQVTEDELAKLHSLFQDFENHKQSFGTFYQEKSKKMEKSRENLYSFLDDTYSDPFDLMVQRQYDQEVEADKEDKIEELTSDISNHLDILERQESHLRSLKGLANYKEENPLENVSLKEKVKNREAEDLFEKEKPFLSSSKIASHFLKDEKEEERSLNLKIKIIVGIAFILNSIIILLLFFHSIR